MANEKAEPLKSQEWIREHGFRDDTVYNLEGVPVCTISDVLAQFSAAHAPSGSPPALEPFGKNFYDSGTVWQAGSVASQEAVCPACGSGDRERAITQLNSLPLSVCPHKWHKASQEAAQPIPSIADVSDHNPNDPSCKACGSAMGWKCLSCGSTTEPTQEAAQPMTGFPIDKTDDWEERQDRARQPDYKGSGNWAEHQKREAGTPAKE